METKKSMDGKQKEIDGGVSRIKYYKDEMKELDLSMTSEMKEAVEEVFKN